MAIRITSDSTCDLGEIAAARNIGVMPLKVNLDTETYLDGVTIVPQDIFAFVEKTKMLPKTSAPSMTDYEEFFEKAFNVLFAMRINDALACWMLPFGR